MQGKYATQKDSSQILPKLRHDDFIEEKECIEVFFEFYTLGNNDENYETVKNLVNMVSCHDLSVELLAKIANKQTYSLPEFYTSLLNIGFGYSDLEEDSNDSSNFLKVTEQLKYLFEFVDFKKEQVRILKNFAVMPNIEIPTNAEKWIDANNDDLNTLIDCGFLTLRENSFYMNPIIKLSILMEYDIKQEDCEKLILSLSSDELIKDVKSEQELNTITAISESVINIFFNESDKIFRPFCNNIAKAFQSLGDFEKTIEYYYKSIKVCENSFGVDHPTTAAAYNNIAGVYQGHGNFDKALDYFKKALEICESSFGLEHPNTAATYNNIAIVYKNQLNYEKALSYYNKALEVCEKVLGDEHPTTAATYYNIAIIYKEQGDYVKSFEFFIKDLNIREKTLGAEHPSTAAAYNNIAGLFREIGDIDSTLKYYDKAISINEKVLGKEHPSNVKTYIILADIYQEIEEYDKSLELYKNTLGIIEKYLGLEHPSISTIHNNIASVYSDKGEHEKALEYYLKSYVVSSASSGYEHANSEIIKNNMKDTYMLLNKETPFEVWFQDSMWGSKKPGLFDL